MIMRATTNDDRCVDAAMFAEREFGFSAGEMYIALTGVLRRDPSAAISNALVATIIKRRRVDEIRKRYGRGKNKRKFSGLPKVINSLAASAEGLSADGAPPDLINRLARYLNPRERTVLFCLIVDEMPMREIETLWGVSCAQVCNIKRSALDKMRAAIAEEFPGLAQEFSTQQKGDKAPWNQPASK